MPLIEVRSVVSVVEGPDEVRHVRGSGVEPYPCAGDGDQYGGQAALGPVLNESQCHPMLRTAVGPTGWLSVVGERTSAVADQVTDE